MRDYVNEIKELNRNYVHIKHPDRVNEAIDKLIDGGFKKLQVASDFDKTITKQHENGKKQMSSFLLFGSCPSVPAEYKKLDDELCSKYGVIEVDPKVPYEEKKKLMEEWWQLSEAALCGLKVSNDEIESVCSSLKPALRIGTENFFNDLYKSDVPVLVFSAGLGDAVTAVLKYSGVLLPNVEVISNFLKYDSEGQILGFKNQTIHVFNKNEYAIKGTEFYKKVVDRDNVILMGDSLGDANMVDGAEQLGSVLKIGFLYEHVEESLPDYMNTFDIVLQDDQTMDVPRAIYDLISLDKTHSELGTN